MLLQQQKQSCDSKWWHFNRHSVVSVLALEKRDVSQSIPVLTICFCVILRCVLGQIAFALFSSLFFNLSLGSSRRKCSNKKKSRVFSLSSVDGSDRGNYSLWSQLPRGRLCPKWTRLPCNCSLSTKVSQMCGKSEKNAIDFRRFFCYEFMKRKKRGRGQKSILSHGLVVLQAHERITEKWPPYTTRCFFCT